MIYSSFSPFLIHLWIGFVSCAVYHIVPSQDHHCPVESCLTLSSFAANPNLYLDLNTSLIFQPGNHIICSKLNVSGVVDFSMMTIANQSRAGIICKNNTKPEFIFNAVNHVHVINLKFFECYHDISYNSFDQGNKLITLTASSLVLVKCIFVDNVGTGVITAANSNITVAQSTFTDNARVKYIMLEFIYCNTMIVSSTFIDNDGRLLFVRVDHEITSISPLVSTLTITGCEFKNNHQSTDDDFFSLITVDVHNPDILLIYDTNFISNKAAKILDANKSIVNIGNSTFKFNHGSAMHLTNSKVKIFNSVFNNNKAGAVRLWNSTVHIHGSEFKDNVEKWFGCGGAIYSSDETLISFSEVCTFADNQAEQGGALYLGYRVQCFIAHGATVIIANNTASDGGGIYLSDHSNITLYNHSTLQVLENRATENGGGIFASELSSINLGFIIQTSNSSIYFYRNQARNGGGLYLEISSVLYIFPCLSNIINFDKNSADYGGAVYVYTAAKFKVQYDHFDPECFFQSETLRNPAVMQCKKKDRPLYFSLNRANYSGFSLYKDAFNNCSMDGTSFEEFELLSIMSNIQTSDVGSSLVQVCFCENGNPECTKEIPFVDIKTGEKLILDVAIADRGNHMVNGSIVSEIRGYVLIRDDQKTQNVLNGCTPLIFNIYSLEASQQLVMSPQLEEDSNYEITLKSDRSVKLNFLACIDCPIGFQQIKDDAKGCDCVCDEIKLKSHIINCNYTRETIIKKDSTAWIDYLNVKNTSGYLIYSHCPMDYCFSPDKTVEINLNIPNGADAQCAHYRSGLLCGTCSPGLSLSLGSTHCLRCFAYWPGVLFAIIFSSMLAGIILVGSLWMLNLTVAAGILNGLIFYANIVASNQYKFFPSTRFVTVFVSLFNLELGIDTCFFDGMDFYWKTWIQLAFPAYILLLVVLMIIISECSVKFAQIVGKRNPIATLDTLILLCYVKFLRIVIVAFSFATLDYPDGSHHVVWWPDATVGYFSGKHIVLWVVAAIIFLAGLFYTVLLFLWQWLLYYQHKLIFKWIQSQRLRMFVEPYHAPYAFKHRYWTGLLLLVRVTIYVISAADVSGDRGITLLAIGIIVIILLVFVSCRPYKSWPVELLEIACYANIAGLCVATFYTSKVGTYQDVVGYISGTINLILFLIVLTYHVVTQLFFKTQIGHKFKNRFNRQLNDSENEEQISLVTTQDSEEGKPATYSEVDPPPRRDAVPPSCFVTDSVSGSANNYDSEENELKPIGQEINSSTPYRLMK